MATTRARVALSAALLVLFVVCVLFTVSQALAPPKAPAEVTAGAPLSPRLADHVLLVIVDGLRYDVATDASRMPNFAAAMREHSSAEIWAGRVSMTSSAVLSYGTGQHGRLEQIVRNLHARPPEHNSWLENARRTGLRLAAVGDTAWRQLYGPQLNWVRADPEGVAIDVDYNAKTFADAREVHTHDPDFMVAHFVTPDHQGHAYGILSERYTQHIQAFDALLAQFLSEFDARWTVIATSDHGAADSGTHGTDVPIQRRSPIFAYGKGVRPRRPIPRLEQVDLSATLPVLLGVAPPAHGTGRVITEWLDVDDSTRADIACRHAARVTRYAASVAPNELDPRSRVDCQRASAEARQISAEQAVREADRAVSKVTGVASRSVMAWLCVTAACSLLLAATLLPQRRVAAWMSAALMLVVSVFLVLQVERLPGIFPNLVRVAFFVLCNGILLALVLRPSLSASWLASIRPHAPAVIPGALVVAYPANARPESFVAAALLGILTVFRSSFFATQREPAPGAPEPPFTWPSAADAGLLVLCVVLLLPVTLRENSTYSSWIVAPLVRAAVLTLLVGGMLFLQRAALRSSWLLPVGTWVGVVLAIWARGLVGPYLGRAAWLGCAGLLGWALYRRRTSLALAAGLMSLCWVARDFEVFPMLGALGLAWLMGGVWARIRAVFTYERFLLACLSSVAISYALRMGLQDGLEFGGMDWGAGAFNDPSVPFWLVGVALVYKYLLAGVLVNLALFRGVAPHVRLRLYAALALCWVVRGLALLAMFVIAGNSYWTALRVFGDLPAMLAFALGSFAAWLLSARASNPTPPLSTLSPQPNSY